MPIQQTKAEETEKDGQIVAIAFLVFLPQLEVMIDRKWAQSLSETSQCTRDNSSTHKLSSLSFR